MRGLNILVFCFLLCCGLTANADVVENVSPNQVTAKFDFESVFQSFTTFSGTHSFSQTHALSGTAVTYLAIRSLELDLSWTLSLGSLSLSPGVGTTFGPVSWSFSTDKSQVLARDLTTFLQLFYRSPLFEAESYTQFWFPVRESWSTAIGFGETRLWGVIKWNELGVGPHMVSFFTKEGGGQYNLSHFWIGGHLLAHVDKATFHLFIGHDAISGVWLGSPKPTGPYFRFTFVYDF